MTKGKNSRKNRKKQKDWESSCPLCDAPDEGDMVLCDWCDYWHHYRCVNLKIAPKSELWFCPKCKQRSQEPIQIDQNEVNNEDVDQRHRISSQRVGDEINPDMKQTADQGAVKKDPNRRTKNLEDNTTPIYPTESAVSSYRSVDRDQRIRIELLRLEEEKHFLQKMQQEKFRLEQQYLERKYEILLNESRQGSIVASISAKPVSSSAKNIKNPKLEDEIDMDEFVRRLDALKLTQSAEEKLAKELNAEDVKVVKTSDQHLTQDANDIPVDLDPSIVNQDPLLTITSKSNSKQHQQSSLQTVIVSANQKKVLVPDECVLTKAQIAARHVVTKDLPIFYGKPEDWLIFHKRYVNSTTLCGFTDGENLDRLQKCLRGTAKTAVRDLLLDADLVPDIIETLKCLFGRPELIVKSLLNEIRQLPNPKADNLNSVVTFALEVRNLAKTIERKELYQFLSNPILLTELVDRLPTTYKVDWAKHIVDIPDNRVTLLTLSNWLYGLMKALIKVTEFIPTESDKKNEKKQTKSNYERVNLHQDEKEKAKPEVVKEIVKKCNICSNDCSSLQDCSVFKSYQPNQRWKVIYDTKSCRKCLRRHGGFCRVDKECGVSNCKYKHHSLLHDDQKHKPNQIAKEKPTKEIVLKTDINASHISYNTRVILRIIPIKISANGITLDTYAFLDDGSTATLIDEKLADELELVGVKKDLCLIWSSNVHRREKDSRQVTVLISSLENPKLQFKLKDVKTVSNLGIPSQRLCRDELCKKFPYLIDIPFVGYERGVPGILIGSNNPKIGVPRKVVEGNDFGPLAVKTKIGWTIYGSIDQFEPNESSQLSHLQVDECKCQHEHDESLHQSMKDYFSVENFGVQVPPNLCTISKNDEKALQQLNASTKRINGRFETSLLWRFENFVFPESYWMAKRRLVCLENKKPDTIKIIDDTINDYIRKGYARKLTKEEAANHEQRHWYLPVFTVTSSKKPEKHRMVFDAAAKVNGVSLNTMLLKGPDQLVSLVEILRRFREKRFALGGDIREMFPQIQMCERDQNCQRFLWRNGNQSKEPDVYVMQVVTFGAACSPCTAHFVKNKNANEFKEEFPRATEAIVKNHYMDDMMEGENSEEELIQLAKDVKRIHSQAGFEIRNFLSNSKKVMDALESTTETESKIINPDKEFEIERVLGMWWNVKTDSFTFSLKYLSVARNILSGEKLPTKREILKLLMSIFDPLGLISHFLIHLKCLVQDIWRTKMNWDEEISSTDLIANWKKWLEVLPTVETIQVPRQLTPKLSKSGTSIEIHTFVDASEKAFGAVTYLRVENESGVDCSLLGSKSRVAPLKYLSIPRKELQSGLLGSRLAKSIGDSQTFKVNRRVFWTDSSTLLSWLGSDNRKYHQFVAHRVGEILENTNLSEWRYVPSKLNVADDLTKWPKDPFFDSSSRWFHGPSFLSEPECNWPFSNEDFGETTEEMKVICSHSELIISPLVDPKRFSNWDRMVRALAYAIRFTNILKTKVKKESFAWSHLTIDELNRAQNLIYRQAQFEGFGEEMVILELNKNLDVKHQRNIQKSSSLVSWSPYLDVDGVLRGRGRTDFAENIPVDAKRPIVLPRKNKITKLLVGMYHRKYHHQNHETVVNEIRQKFHIPKLRVVLKSIYTNDCQRCKIRRARPQPPEEGNLPAGRMAIGFRPFTHTGIDYFGPMSITQGRSTVKRWGVLFTCLTTRAIHMEIAYSISTKSCIDCIRNFINFRGEPRELYSDCGTNLVGTDNELQRALEEVDMNELASTFTTQYCKWNFNPPEAKHMGGVWERLVRTIKSCLYEIMPTRNPSDEMFRSLLLEVMNVVNSRPLTFIPLDNANDEALTPNHFIHGSSNGLKPPGDFGSDGPFLRSEWKEIQRLTDCFWQRFIKEYLPTLTRKTKWFHPVKPIEVGDIVLVIDEKNSRNVYPKARVVEIVIGSNNQVRRARVQFANGSILWRGAAGLARLDLSSDVSLTAP